MVDTALLKLGDLESAASTTARSKEAMGSSCLVGCFCDSVLSFVFFKYSHNAMATEDQEAGDAGQ